MVDGRARLSAGVRLRVSKTRHNVLKTKGSAMTQPLTIDVVSDVVCPWCFIGKKRLEKALALRPDIPVEVRWHPYFLNDWVPREGISRDEYLTKKFGSPERYKEHRRTRCRRRRCRGADL